MPEVGNRNAILFSAARSVAIDKSGRLVEVLRIESPPSNTSNVITGRSNLLTILRTTSVPDTGSNNAVALISLRYDLSSRFCRAGLTGAQIAQEDVPNNAIVRSIPLGKITATRSFRSSPASFNYELVSILFPETRNTSMNVYRERVTLWLLVGVSPNT